MPRTGVILAAGFGSRLKARASGPKPLTKVGGVALVQRMIVSLEKAGCTRIVVVVGHGKDELISGLAAHRGQTALVFAENPRYDLKNGVSVLAARSHLLGDVFVLAMADHVVDDAIARVARDWTPPPGTAGLLVDYKISSIFDLDDATKVLAAQGRVESIGKSLASFNCIDCGVFVCTTALMDAIAAVYHEVGDASLSDGVQALAREGKMFALDIGEAFWQDVDTPEMLAYAERMLALGAKPSSCIEA